MRILVVAPFCSLPGEPYFNRFLYLAQLLGKRHEVTLVTSRFRHFDKSWRAAGEHGGEGYKLVLLEEDGYYANVSLSRLKSHRSFVLSFRAWFEANIQKQQFDLVYSAFPLISTNLVLGEQKKWHKFRLIIDIQDLWPESISAALAPLSHLPPRFIPFSWRADRAYKAADALVAVSKTHMQRALGATGAIPNRVVYIGADAQQISAISPIPFPSVPGAKNFVYLGTLSHSYDIKTLTAGFNVLYRTHPNYCLHVIGTGPDHLKLAASASPNVIFHGARPYPEAIGMAKSAEVLVNPIRHSSKAAITNKISDYLLLGKPILNSQTNWEVLELLNSVASAHYRSGDVSSLLAGVRSILTLPTAKKADLSAFDRSVTYPALVSFIEDVARVHLVREASEVAA